MAQAGAFDPSPESLRTNPFLQPASPLLHSPVVPPQHPVAARGAAARKRLVLDDSNPLVSAAPVLPDPHADAALSQEHARMGPAAATSSSAAPDAAPARSRELPGGAAAGPANLLALSVVREHGGAELTAKPAGLEHVRRERTGATAASDTVGAVATPEGYRNPFAGTPPAAPVAGASAGSAAGTPEPAADPFARPQVAGTPGHHDPFAVPPPAIRVPPRAAGPVSGHDAGPPGQGSGSGSPAPSMRMGSGSSGGTRVSPGGSNAAWQAPTGTPGDAGSGSGVWGGAMQPSASAPLGGAAALLLGGEVCAFSRTPLEVCVHARLREAHEKGFLASCASLPGACFARAAVPSMRLCLIMHSHTVQCACVQAAPPTTSKPPLPVRPRSAEAPGLTLTLSQALRTAASAQRLPPGAASARAGARGMSLPAGLDRAALAPVRQQLHMTTLSDIFLPSSLLLHCYMFPALRVVPYIALSLSRVGHQTHTLYNLLSVEQSAKLHVFPELT